MAAGSPSQFWPFFFTAFLSALVGSLGTWGVMNRQFIDTAVKVSQLEKDNQRLVEEKTKAETARDKAIANQKRERDAIYQSNQEAKTWANQPVPEPIRQRMQSIAANYKTKGNPN